MRTIWRQVRQALIGRGLRAALKRNREAADTLDAALREVLGR